MTADENALLAAVCANPGDDNARLVYADWLQEHGQEERAEFVRVQCELARGPDACRLRKRERELKPLTPKWFPGLSYAENTDEHYWIVGGIGWPTIVRRGFVSSVTCPAAVWLEHGDALIWRPGQTEKCPGCGGLSLGRSILHDLMVQDRDMTPCCDGSGRVPRPCPPTAQPVTRVRLTDRPAWAVEFSAGLADAASATPHPLPERFRFTFRYGDGEWGRLTVTSDGAGMRCESDRFPGVTFELPETYHFSRVGDPTNFDTGGVEVIDMPQGYDPRMDRIEAGLRRRNDHLTA